MVFTKATVISVVGVNLGALPCHLILTSGVDLHVPPCSLGLEVVSSSVPVPIPIPITFAAIDKGYNVGVPIS